MWLAALGGMILKLDHSFKACKRIRDGTGHKQYAAILTVMNEFCQVIVSWWPDKALSNTIASRLICGFVCRCWGASPHRQSPSQRWSRS